MGGPMAGMASGGGMGAQGLLQMVMGIVYPSMKPLFEASIRRITVTVKWKEGPNAKEIALVQYVTNPQLAGFTAGAIPGAAASASGGAPLNAPPPQLTGPGMAPNAPRVF
jgi:general secretion pathway protein I